MKREVIKISKSGNILVPDNTSMASFEIADLFEVYIQTVNANIRAIIKSGLIATDISGGVTLERSAIIPNFFGLEMITALAFRIQSPKAQLFRECIFSKMHTDYNKLMPTYILLSSKLTPN